MRIINAGETNATVLQAYFDVRLLDNITPALNEAGNQPQISLNGAGFSSTGIGPLMAIGFGRYYASLSPIVVLTPGTVILIRYQGAATYECRGDEIQVIDPLTGVSAATAAAVSVNFYGTVDGGDTYFNSRLNNSVWFNASPDDRRKALTMATQAIDKLNFCGDKADSNQILQFPRGNTWIVPTNSVTDNTTITSDDVPQTITTQDVLVPADIEIATYLCAYKYLDGYDPEIEEENIAMTENKYGTSRSGYDRSFVLEHIKHGIPSIEAWKILKMYLRDPLQLTISRI